MNKKQKNLKKYIKNTIGSCVIEKDIVIDGITTTYTKRNYKYFKGGEANDKNIKPSNEK